MLIVKVFKSKKGNKCYALCYNDIYVTFDTMTIFKIFGSLTWKEFEELDFGQYEV